MLEMAVMSLWRPRVISNVAFSAGSSRQGNAFLASFGENCVTAIHLKQIMMETAGRPAYWGPTTEIAARKAYKRSVVCRAHESTDCVWEQIQAGAYPGVLLFGFQLLLIKKLTSL